MLLASVIIAPNDQTPQAPSANPREQAHTEQNPIESFVNDTFSDPVSFFTLALVGSTILLWRATLLLAREARQSSVGQVAKMARQNEISEDTARRQLRAYVLGKDHQIASFFAGGRMRFLLKLHNFGQTPAYDVRFITLIRATADEVDRYRFFFRARPALGLFSRTIIGPGDFHVHVNEMEGPLAREPWTMILRGDLKVIFAGVVSYRDAFGVRHLTTFKYFLNPADLNIKEVAYDLAACGNGNKAN